MGIELTIQGPVQIMTSSPVTQGTDQPERFQHEIYVHEGHMAFLFQGLSPETEFELSIGFAELFYQSEGKRVQDVFVNGQRVMTDYDIVADVGPRVAVEKIIKGRSDQSGELRILFRTKLAFSCADICNLNLSGDNIEVDFVAGQEQATLTQGRDRQELTISFDPQELD
jgi:hypothetical protein